MKRAVRRVGRRVVEAGAALLGAVLPQEARVVFRNGLRQVSRLDYEKASILLHVDSEVELRTRLKSCGREPDTVAWLEQALGDRDVFYDVGANVGAYSLLAARIAGRARKVIAFEPSAVTFAQLVRNIALNDCQDIVTPFQLALSGSTTLDMFSYSGLESGQALHSLGGGDHAGEDRQARVRMPVLAYRLDDLIAQFKLPSPNLVKIDVDGGELGVLEGAPLTLGNPALREVLVETDERGADHPRIVALLERAGLTVAAKRAIVPGENGQFAGLHNYIFSRTRGPAGGPR